MIENSLELERLKIQHQLDKQKTQEERNKLGQFATPTKLAMEMLEYTKSLLPPNSEINFLDPAIGTGSFYSALLRTFPTSQITAAMGYEIDPLCGLPSTNFWNKQHLKLYITDFTQAIPPNINDQKPNLLICNPPYVRHHHLQKAEKQRLQKRSEQETEIKLSEQAGLYAHFLLISHNWMAENGLAGWLIPGEFMSVNYGRQIKKYLLTKVTLLHIHCFNPNDVQFEDALVSSAIVWFKKSVPPDDHVAKLTYGGTLLKPKISKNISIQHLSSKAKWSGLFLDTDNERIHVDENIKRNQENNILEKKEEQLLLSDFFDVKRGIATGANKYFILSQEQASEYQIPKEFLTPILPNPRNLKSNVIEADEYKNPILDQKLYLLTCNLPLEDVENKYLSLWKYLQIGIKTGINNGYLCQSRKLWYLQEKRPECTFLCAYMGRQNSEKNTPFRFILNFSAATATNSYHILCPKPMLKKVLEDDPKVVIQVWQAFETIAPKILIEEGRVYGGGMHKLEPSELANVPAGNIFQLIQKYLTLAQINHLNKKKAGENKELHIQTLWDK